MASACVNKVDVSPENFPVAGKFPLCGWLSPRASLSRENDHHSGSASGSDTKPKPTQQSPAADTADAVEIQDPGDFEFRLEDLVAMLTADELFSDGKLVPLQFSCSKEMVNVLTKTRSPENGKCRRLEMEISGTDPYIFSPKAPRCSSRWRELLGLKRFSQNNQRTSVASSSSLPSNPKLSSSLKHLLHRSSKSCSSSSGSSLDASTLSLPLLKDAGGESLSISSSRVSLSSSSSGHNHEDLPRISLDSEKPSLNSNPSPNPFAPARSLNPNPPRMRLVRRMDGNQTTVAGGRVGRRPMRQPVGESSGTVMSRGVSVDSPRLNSSGKIVFQSLERSSSSPSNFNGGPNGYRHRGMERCYPSNFRVTPVLNVPVCSLRGASKSGLFGQFFYSSSSSSSSSSSQQKNGNGANRGVYQHGNGKNRTDRN